MQHKKSITCTAIALITTMLFCSVGCSSQEEPAESVVSINGLTLRNDTIYITTDASTIQKSDMNSVPTDLRYVLESTNPSRSSIELNEDMEVYYFQDEVMARDAYAIADPTAPNSCIIECESTISDASVIISFEQVSDNEFIALDEDGELLRTFYYDPETQELWTSNDPTRKLSRQDRILCGTMFTALNVLISDALAIPSGGASLLLGLGCQVAAMYVCD